jgi:hypothetical protein
MLDGPLAHPRDVIMIKRDVLRANRKYLELIDQDDSMRDASVGAMMNSICENSRLLSLLAEVNQLDVIMDKSHIYEIEQRRRNSGKMIEAILASIAFVQGFGVYIALKVGIKGGLVLSNVEYLIFVISMVALICLVRFRN